MRRNWAFLSHKTYCLNLIATGLVFMVADLCHVVLSCFRGEKAPRENPPSGDVFVFSHGDLSPRHTKIRHFSCVAFSPPVCRIFAWRGERSPRENPPKSPFGGFSRGAFSPFRPENTIIRNGTNQPPYVFVDNDCDDVGIRLFRNFVTVASIESTCTYFNYFYSDCSSNNGIMALI